MVDTHELHDDEFVRDEEGENAQDQDLELEAEEELSADKLRSLRQKLKDAEADKREALEEKERTRADFLNSKRRLEDQFRNDRERLIERVIEDFLPLMDSFETALSQKGTGDEDHWEKGVMAMYTQFLNILKRYDVTEIETEGKTFNPHEHEAVSTQKGDHGETSEKIMHVVQKGYRRGDTIIRPAKVIISE